jgi:hypothetical protein
MKIDISRSFTMEQRKAADAVESAVEIVPGINLNYSKYTL